MRRKVATAAGAGMLHQRIAIVLGISEPTLRKYFERELSEGAFRKRYEVIDALHSAAKKGNVSAAKAYLALDPQLAVPPLPERDPVQPTAAAQVPQTAQEQLGKKAQADRDARTAHVGTGWDQLLGPQPTPQ